MEHQHPARSMKGILMLFEDPVAPFSRDTEAFNNPKVTVEIMVEGVPNQLNSQGMSAHHLWDEAKNFLAAGSKGSKGPMSRWKSFQ